MSLFEELKRRNVFRVGIAYIVAAWLLVQIADLAFDIVGVGDGLLRGVAILLALGFIPTVIFAWAFELTPEGIKREREVNRDASITSVTAKKLDFVTIGLLVTVLAVFAVDRLIPSADVIPSPDVSASSGVIQADTSSGTPIQDGIHERSAETSDAVALPPAKSIAVLPFVNMSDDTSNEYFSDGISEEILNALAKVKDLKVAGRTSSFAFKGQNQDLRVIGEALGVGNILEGSVRKAGNKVRITAQLIQVEDGFHLWSETYDRELDDVFAIQDEISAAILEQLKAHLLDGEQVEVVSTRADSETYDLYLLAKQRIYERTRPALESANELLDRALTIDPDYAPAYAQRGIATLLLSDRNYGTIPKVQAANQAKVYIDQALRLDSKQDEALAALGLYHAQRPGETQPAIEALEAALAVNPNNVNAANWLQSAYSDAGQLSEAMTILEDLRVRDPLYRPGIANLNRFYMFQNRLEEAREQIEHLKPFMPNDPFLLRLEANVFYSQGELAEGFRIAEQALSIQPDNFPNIELVGRGLDGTGQFERLSEEGAESQRPFALIQLGRTEEAFLAARQRADSGEDVESYIGLLANYGKPEEAVKFIEERWASLEDYAKDHPTAGGTGTSIMLDIAYAYSVTGNEQRFEDAMRRARVGLDELHTLGFNSSYIEFINAVYHTMAGDHDQALALLASAIDHHYTAATKLSNGWSALKALEGNPEYESIQQRVIDHVNAERAELGLEPLST
ncbi:MAG TPA: tetratricopeptide repeat protein [Xanthomonadales bacterium]|nr:tetratricopeptide repeat protein [Xanthomonadales bacterium]